MGDLTGLKRILQTKGIPFVEKEPLARHTTFKIGGPAQVFCTPSDQKQLAEVIAACQETAVRYYLLGKGSNILFADTGFDGAIICIGSAMSAVRVEKNIVIAQAGALLAKVCTAAADAGLRGLEFAFGIPGCIGGAVYMNAGAYGGEIKDVLHTVTILDETGVQRTLLAEQLELGYRTSIFERKPWCILSASFALQPDDVQQIHARMKDYAHRRAEKQPLDMPSAGSTFKRPVGAYAGALIEQCGLRGYAVGGAAISAKHCGFVVNTGGATCADVLALTDEVCSKVTRQTGYLLEKEIRVVK